MFLPIIDKEFHLAILLEFSFSWSYFLLTQLKLIVFTLAYISQTLTILYMVFMASQAQKKLVIMIYYSIFVFVIGYVFQLAFIIYIEGSAKEMLEKQDEIHAYRE